MCVCVCVCVCVGSPSVYMKPSSTFSTCRPFWEMFRKRHDNTMIHASHMGNYMLHAGGSVTLQTLTFRLLTGKERTSVTFQTDGNITILLHVFAFLLKTLYSFTMLSFSCTCVLLRNYWTLSYVTWRIFHSDTFPQFIPPPFLLHNTQNCYPVSPLVIPGNAGYPC